MDSLRKKEVRTLLAAAAGVITGGLAMALALWIALK